MKYNCKRIKTGKYEYRGIIIECLGYYPPDRHIVWKGSCNGSCGDYQGYTLLEVKTAIDNDLDK